jgi:hypothetical protein
MSNENPNNTGMPPAPPFPNQQPAASQQGWSQQPQQAWGQQPQQGWGQPVAPQQQVPQPPQPQQQAWQAPQPPQPQQQAWQQPQQQPQQQTWQQPGPPAASGQAPTWDQLKAGGNYQIPPEYPAATFRPESFSIPAFFFSWIWYMVKGMWQKGLLLLVVGMAISLATSGIGGLAMAIYAGMYGHRDYMRYHNSKAQFWF